MSIETDSPVVYHGTSESRFPKEVEKVVTNLTAQEKELLRQCNKESLYYRCLPLSLSGMVGVYIATKKGFLLPHPVWGSALKMSGVALLGWIVGKLSYRTKCEDKFVQLENSNIGEMIRKQRGIILERSQSDFSQSKFQDDLTFKDDSSFGHYSDRDYHSSAGSLNLDTDKNIQYSGLDDRERPSTDRATMQSSQEPEPTRMFTTYDDLRHRNREEYARLQRSPPPSSMRSDTSASGASRPLNNVDSSPPRRYSSDFNEADHMQSSQEPEPTGMSTTYDGLRHRNREEYGRLQRSPPPSSMRSDTSASGAPRPLSNVDSSPPRRYSSDFNEGDRRRSDSNMWDNAKVL